MTPVEEVVKTLDELAARGLVRHIGLSDVPAWYAARAWVSAEAPGRQRVIALQLGYSLVERSFEREHIPMARSPGMGITPWSPLASGLSSGKFGRGFSSGQGRLTSLDVSKSPIHAKYASERNFHVVDALVDAARELGRSPAQVALNWMTRRSGVSSTIIGATRVEQLDENLRALEFELPEDHRARLDRVSAIDLGFTCAWFGVGPNNPAMSGGTRIIPGPG